jgi:hypothetical protein
MRMKNIAILLCLFASSLAAQVQIGKNVQIGSNATAGVTSVSNGDGTLTISPTAGAVIAAINLAHINTWTANQTFGNITVTGTCTGCGGGITGLTAGYIPLAGSATTLTANSHIHENTAGQTTVTQTLVVTGSGIPVATKTTSNTDLAGFLTLSGGMQTYTFSATHATAPVCTATDTTAVNAVQASASTTVLTVTGTGTDVVSYICIGRT